MDYLLWIHNPKKQGCTVPRQSEQSETDHPCQDTGQTAFIPPCPSFHTIPQFASIPSCFRNRFSVSSARTILP